MDTKNPISIRQAFPQDHDFLSTIPPSVEISKTWQMEQFFDDGAWSIRFREVSLPRPVHLAYPASEKIIRDRLIANDLTLVAEDNSVSVGFLSLANANGSPMARVTDLVVDPQHRRKGIATALLIGAVDWLVERRFSGITLEMMLKNHPAINFCRKLGFHLTGFNDVYYSNGQTAIYFHRNIA
jgi:ribosomal protein S18 acetylase RimI-like enzyme